MCSAKGDVRFTPPKADICSAVADVRYGPEADILRHDRSVLFDHFVGGGEQFGWNVEAECRGSIEVDYKFKLGRQHDR